ncbi:lysine--tRNA ligase [bacterium]|nr:MAG: lysine--tRNA ligase [bacterium]RIK63052.1 MAG: lysine--tRNA ligase [Planctomycetota bacterium]
MWIGCRVLWGAACCAPAVTGACMPDETIDQYRAQRMAKRDALARMGVNPYAVRTPARQNIAPLKAEFEKLEAASPKVEGKQDGPKIGGRAVAGRVLANRKMGKAVFLDLFDESGKIQVYLNAKSLGEQAMAVYEQIDLGDFIWVKGDVQRTRTGEITLFAAELKFLTKSLAVPPLPRVYKDEQGVEHSADAFTDTELRYRKRYLDLMVHSDVRRRFEQRSLVLAAIREYLGRKGYLEVETPMLHPIPGGARARPFITHHNALHMNMYLRIAPELYLKRLLVGGFERVFEINRNFRNEGIDPTHNPEFTMMELYEAYGDYHSMMEITEGLIRHAAQTIRPDGNLLFKWGEVEIDLGKSFARRRYTDLLREYARVDLHDMAGMKARAKELGLEVHDDHYKLADQVLEATALKHFIQPTFLIDYPTAICPLTKAREDDPQLCERFELFINGVEFANAFSELNEPTEQLKRFREQVELGEKTKDVEAPKEVDYDYVEALEAGMPPAGGLGVGIDRLVMLLTNTHSIRDVLLFPHMKRDHSHGSGGATQRAQLALETLVEEITSPELRKLGREVAPIIDRLEGLVAEFKVAQAARKQP